MVRRPQVILLDFDGTLAATHRAVMECIRRTSVELGHPAASDDSLAATIARGLSLPQTFAALIPGLSPSQIEASVETYRAHYPTIDMEHSLLFEGVVSTLRSLHAEGVSLVVLSNKGTPAITAALQRFALDSFIHSVLAQEHGLPTKPDPALFHTRVAPLFPGVPQSDFLMVGDTPTDLRFARGLDMPCCWASYGYGDPDACRQLVPDYQIDSFPALLSVLASIGTP